MEAGKEGGQPGPGQPRAQQTPKHRSRDPSPTLRRDGSQSHVPAIRKQPSTGLISSLPPSLKASPQSSRNTSPIRPSVRPQETPQQTLKTSGLRSRKDSQDASPIRPQTSTTHSSGNAPPSAAAIQRALSAASIPQLNSGSGGSGSVSEAVSKLPRTSKTTPSSEAPTPVSPGFPPRMKSPGPSAPSSRRNSLQHKKGEYMNAPGIVVQSSTPPPTAVPDLSKSDKGSDAPPQALQTPKIGSRGPSGPKPSLETVEEATPPASSILADATDQSFSSMNSSQTTTKSSDDDRTSTSASSKKDGLSEKPARSAESDGDGSKSKKEPLHIDQAKAKQASSKSAPPSARAKHVDGTRNMTVETETVASIPQSALNNERATGPRDGGSLRMKPSNETIRPRKERKRATRKTPSVHNGTASSKADIFEARVASAVDEANSSDSDETFVYESNPPEPQLRSHRNHSRTPSVTSVQSQSERRGGLRAYDNHRVAGKRSMKFSNNPYSVLDSPTDGDSGTIRAHHPRNISRFGRTIGSNSSLYDQDSPFTQASKLRQNLANSNRQSSRPGTPQQPKSAPAQAPNRAFGPWGRKYDGSSPQYDFDGEGADDERTPLVGTVRTPRNRHQRRHNRSYEDIYNIRQTSFLGRFGGCFLGSIVVLLIVFGAASFLFFSSKVLYDVEIHAIQNVLASEQELMLDLVVGAVNPNVLGVTVADMDINIFAKSKHMLTTTSAVATPTATPTPSSAPNTAQRRSTSPRHRQAAQAITANDKPHVPGTPWQDPNGRWNDGDDEGLEGDSQTMLLGRVSYFDQGLYFEGSPLKRHIHFSTGEFRLAKPGNKTEAGGSERWERVLQYPFELILRGVLRYNLPVSGRWESAAVRGSVVVHPEEGIGAGGSMRIEKPSRKELWHWVEHENIPDWVVKGGN